MANADPVLFPVVAAAPADSFLPANVEPSTTQTPPIQASSSDRPAFGAVARDVDPDFSPSREHEWLEEARHYNRHLQWVLVWLSTLVAIPGLIALLTVLGRSTGGWWFFVVAYSLFAANFAFLAMSCARAFALFLRADKRLRQMGYSGGSAHDALRVIETCAESGEVRFVCPPPRDELALTPAWPSHAADSERSKLGRALLEIGFPSRRRPWKSKRGAKK